MAPLVKPAIVSKTGEEASLLIFLHLLYTPVEKQPYLVSIISYKFSAKSILSLMCV